MNNSDLAAKNRRTRMILLICGLFIYSAFVYGSGMEAMIRKARVVNEQRKLADQDYRDAQRDLRLRIAAVEQLEARRQVTLALDDLDKRNFGTAQDAVQRAATLLTQAQAQDTIAPDLTTAEQALKATNLIAAADVGAQRAALQGIAGQMDAEFAKFTPDLIANSTAQDMAHPIHHVTMNDVPAPPENYKGADLTTGQDFRK